MRARGSVGRMRTSFSESIWTGLCGPADAPPGRRVSPRPTVLSVARMYPRKRLDDLLRAAAILRLRIPDVQVRIVGAGPMSDRLRRLHSHLALGDTAVFLGEVARAQLSVE